MKAEDYICEWCDKTYGGGKELGDWETDEVMKFANDFAEKKASFISPSLISEEEYTELMKNLYPK
jgi:hypothetical protein